MFHQHNCPNCGSTNLVKNGSTYYGKAKLLCKSCGRQFVEFRQYAPLSNECKRRIELMLAERISLEAICRVMEIKPHQLYAYMDELYDEIPADLACSVANKSDIELVAVDCEADELWSFVGCKANKQWLWRLKTGLVDHSIKCCKANKQWLWLALDRASRQVVGLFVGDRSADGALGLWQALPERYRQQATFHTDDWQAYKQIIPTHQHRFSKQKKDTNHVERFFCTLRQRCARLVRLSLSFSKKLDRHINAIKFMATHYNLSLQV